jgi:RimJ/RimL family protein N-acetyltransferase
MNKKSNLDRPRFLEGKRLFLTPLSMDDLDNNFFWDNDAEMSFLDGGSFRPKSCEKARAEFEKTLAAGTDMFFSIILKDTGEQAGNIVLFNLLELLAYVFEDLGYRRLKSDTHAGNIGSQKFQESLGFVKEGVLRRERYVRGGYVDDILYGMVHDDYQRLYGHR